MSEVDCKRHGQLIHRLAIGTAIMSLIPILLGSLVTTLGAGMAFLDWPTSDGEGMLTYPWLKSSGDKFIEHGHRLGGVLIGICSIGLCVATHWLNAEASVKAGSILVLAGVIVQGLIGGLRVRLDAQTVALGHSLFGCLVFSSLWMVALISRPARKQCSQPHSGVKWPGRLLAVAVLLICFGQYTVGAFLRHLGLMMHLHLAGAIAVLLITGVVLVRSSRTDMRLRSRSRSFAIAVGLQVAIGLGAWATRFGLPWIGFVATQHSLPQVTLRSLHTLGGMCVVATAIAWTAATVIPPGFGRRTATNGQSLDEVTPAPA